MTSFCVLKFVDESLGRIAPTELVKLDKNRKFSPASARDLPEGTVLVKWQKSMAGDEFSSATDGYFPAEIVAIAGSVKTALAKAAEMKFRLHPNPVLSLPATNDVNESSSRRSKKNPKPKDLPSVSPGLKETQRKSVKQSFKDNASSVKPAVKEAGRSPENKSSSKDRVQKDRESPAKKRKRTKLNEVAVERCKTQLQLSLSNNPVCKGLPYSHANVEEGSNEKEQRCSKQSQLKTKPQMLKNPNISDTSQPVNLDEDEDNNLDDDQFNTDEIDKQHDQSHPFDLHGDENSNGRQMNADEGFSQYESDEKEVQDRSNKVKGPFASGVKCHAASDSDADTTIPVSLDNSMKDLEEEDSSSSSESSSHSDSESEDEVSRLAAAKKVLERELARVKDQLAEKKREITVANNLRIAYKDQVASLKKKLEDKVNLVETLQLRNGMLQDKLCEISLGSRQSQTDERRKVEISKRHLVDDFSFSTPKKSKFDDTADVLETCGSENEGAGDDAQKPSADKQTSHSDQKKDEKKKKGSQDKDSEEIKIVCERVLNHLNKKECLKEDDKGFVNVGCNVKVDKAALERTLKDHRGDVQKISKNMAALTSTTTQRAERSLEGGKNNGFPNAPSKKAATPHKVNACLGVVKAHLLFEGERDGPGLAQNLKMGRKAIGAKFAQDSNLAKKRAEKD